MPEVNDKVCKICGSNDYRSYLRFKDKKKEVVACKACGTFRTLPYYETDYKEQEFYCEHYIRNERIFRGFADNLVNIILRYKKEGRLLDIGCAVGFVLEEAKKKGFKAEGIELNKKAADITRSKGFDVNSCAIRNAGYNNDSFDVVVLNHILEHIAEPHVFLKDIKDIVKKSGILLIGVPNHASLAATLFRRKWYGWGIPEHIWHFDKNSIGYLLSKNGFKIKALIQNSQYYPFSKSLRKNTRAVIARIGNIVSAGDQLIAIAGVE